MEIKNFAFENGHDQYRMYGLVPYNLSPIQQGIQFGHGVVEYANEYFSTTEYQTWSKECKTFIILNGGTTNHKFKPDGTMTHTGSLNQHLDTIKELKIPHAYFCEPDLGDQLTAVVFLVDERVYNKEKYPDYAHDLHIDDIFDIKEYHSWKFNFSLDIFEAEKIIKLREFLSQFRLA